MAENMTAQDTKHGVDAIVNAEKLPEWEGK